MLLVSWELPVLSLYTCGLHWLTYFQFLSGAEDMGKDLYKLLHEDFAKQEKGWHYKYEFHSKVMPAGGHE